MTQSAKLFEKIFDKWRFAFFVQIMGKEFVEHAWDLFLHKEVDFNSPSTMKILFQFAHWI